MPTNPPLTFTEALRYLKQKKLMPTHLKSADLEMLQTAVRERALFSARTLWSSYLEKVGSAVERILKPETKEREDGSKFTDGLDLPRARLELREALKEIGYRAEKGKEGTLEDLSSEKRLNLVVETNVEMAQGYGQWTQGQDEAVLDQWPGQELFRAEARKMERDWETRWIEAAQSVRDMNALRVFGETGRMITRKDSAIWSALSRFGQPYPPFDFQSGMWVRDIDREESEALGLLQPGERLVPKKASFEMEVAA